MYRTTFFASIYDHIACNKLYFRQLQCNGEDLLVGTPVCTPLSQHYDYALDKPPTILFRHQNGKQCCNSRHNILKSTFWELWIDNYNNYVIVMKNTLIMKKHCINQSLITYQIFCKGPIAQTNTGELLVYPGAILHMECLYQKRHGVPVWSTK